jgi:4-hydroxybenzoyl-CoA reductase subunit alpha
MNAQHKVIGRSLPRIDGPEKVTGAAKYTGDIKFPNMLYGKILTSPHAHARILSIDTSAAEKLPGVKAVITHRDVPDLKYGISPARWDENIFCVDKVRFVGDKVAAVACVDEATCYEALRAIRVEYQELPAVLDFRHAMDEGQPLVQEAYARNINTEIHQEFGDIEKAFAEAHHVRTDAFLGQRTYQAPLEPHSATALWEGEKLTIYCSTQSPHYFQYYIAREFGLPMGDVRIIKPYVGGGFGGKLEPTGLEFAGTVLARLTGRPVRMFYDRAEMFAHNRGRHAQYMEITTGVTKEGKLLAAHANFMMDGGAYTSLGIATAYYAGALLPLTYEFDHYKFDMVRVYTNLPACGAQRGHGAPQPKYAFESHLDNVAKDLGIDPLAMRLLNARRPDTVTPNDFRVNSCGMRECLEKVRQLSGWDEKKAHAKRGRGIGVATGSFVSGAGYPIYRTDLPQASAFIKVHEDGTAATLYTGASDIGQGSDTILCQMAAEGMGYRYEQMKVVSADTETTPHDFGAYASRQTLMSGAAAKMAGEEVKQQILDMASAMLQLPVADLDCEDGIVFSKSRPGKALPFEEVARQCFVLKGPLIGRGVYFVPKLGGKFKGAAVGTSPAYSFGAQVGEVEIDEETGEIQVVGVWDVHDSGTVINPRLFHGQVHGALAMGIGESVWEQVVFDDQGKIRNAELANYRLLTALDMPPIQSEVVETVEPSGPWGVKEIGEGSTNPTMGCFSNAIFDAMGVRVNSLPLSYEKVWRALKEQRQREQQSS